MYTQCSVQKVRIGFKYGLGLTHVIKALSRREGEVGVPAAALAGAAGGRVTQNVPTVDREGIAIPTTGGTFSGASSLIGKHSQQMESGPTQCIDFNTNP